MTRTEIAVLLAWTALIGVITMGVSQGWNQAQIFTAVAALAVVVVGLHRWSHR